MKKRMEKYLRNMEGEFVYIHNESYTIYSNVYGYLYKDKCGWYSVCNLVKPHENYDDISLELHWIRAFSDQKDVILEPAKEETIQEMKRYLMEGKAKFSGDSEISEIATAALLSHEPPSKKTILDRLYERKFPHKIRDKK
jgi:hypothetical protein